MIGTRSSIARLTADPMAPEELSTRSRAGDRRSSRQTAPSAASAGSRRATFLISLTACFSRWMAGCDLQPNADRRKRALNSQVWVSALTMRFSRVTDDIPPRRGGGADPLPLAPDPRRAPVFAILRREASSGTMESTVVITGGEFTVPARQEFLASLNARSRSAHQPE